MENPLENTAIQVTYGKSENAPDPKAPLEMPADKPQESQESQGE